MKILHIDESAEICELYSDMILADNDTIQSLNTGKEGLDLVIKNDYDPILLDMCIPKYSGMDFFQDLKHKRSSELRKVVVTSVLQFSETQVKKLMKFGIH